MKTAIATISAILIYVTVTAFGGPKPNTNGFRLTVTKSDGATESIEISQVADDAFVGRWSVPGRPPKSFKVDEDQFLNLRHLADKIHWGPYSDVENVVIEAMRTEIWWSYEYWTASGDHCRKSMPLPPDLAEIEGEKIRGMDGVLAFARCIRDLGMSKPGMSTPDRPNKSE